jgi:hypothetical protein
VQNIILACRAFGFGTVITTSEFGLPLDQGRGDVVAIPEPLLAAVARGHAVAAVVKNAAAQQ